MNGDLVVPSHWTDSPDSSLVKELERRVEALNETTQADVGHIYPS